MAVNQGDLELRDQNEESEENNIRYLVNRMPSHALTLRTWTLFDKISILTLQNKDYYENVYYLVFDSVVDFYEKTYEKTNEYNTTEEEYLRSSIRSIYYNEEYLRSIYYNIIDKAYKQDIKEALNIIRSFIKMGTILNLQGLRSLIVASLIKIFKDCKDNDYEIIGERDLLKILIKAQWGEKLGKDEFNKLKKLKECVEKVKSNNDK